MKYRVNVDLANQTKAEFSEVIDGKDGRLLNTVGAFSSLFLLDLGTYTNPVLVLKTEEPGSKQVLAFAHDRVESVCHDMINHLINDCIVMGAEPLAVQDLIVCGKIDGPTVKRIVAACAAACEAQGCVLTGGETSEQPGILDADKYILGSNVVGIVERDQIIDGSHITVGDIVVAIQSSGPHTNGYTLIRDLIAQNPELLTQQIDNRPFLDLVLEPHRCYYQSLKNLFQTDFITGMAHITGGGIQENLNRILPSNCNAVIDLSTYQVKPVFGVIKQRGSISDEHMLRTFNLGVGIAVVCQQSHVAEVVAHIQGCGEYAYPIGEIAPGHGEVVCTGALRYGTWD